MHYVEGRTSKEFAAINLNEADQQEYATPMIQGVSANRDYDIRRTR